MECRIKESANHRRLVDMDIDTRTFNKAQYVPRLRNVHFLPNIFHVQTTIGEHHGRKFPVINPPTVPPNFSPLRSNNLSTNMLCKLLEQTGSTNSSAVCARLIWDAKDFVDIIGLPPYRQVGRWPPRLQHLPIVRFSMIGFCDAIWDLKNVKYVWVSDEWGIDKRSHGKKNVTLQSSLL